MSDKHKTDLDEFACIHCGHVYHRHGLRETFCDNCDEILKVEKVDVDMVNHPPHYKDASGIECIEVTKHMQFCGGNCFKYLYRAGKKGSTVEDLKKAAWYAERAWIMNEIVSNEVFNKIFDIAHFRLGNIAAAMDSVRFNEWDMVEKHVRAEIARLESE